MRPATMIALVFLLAVIFVPAMFIDIGAIKEGIPPDSNGLTPPPIGAPPPASENAANTPAPPVNEANAAD